MRNVDELELEMLDCWVAKALGHSNIAIKDGVCQSFDPIDESWRTRRFSTDWSDGGPVIERQRIMIDPAFSNGPWLGTPTSATDGGNRLYLANCEIPGATPLIAAMRAFVAWKFDHDVPDGVP